MKCPKCRSPSLVPTKLEEGLPAMGCRQCEGALVSLLYYRDWSERDTPLSNVAPAELAGPEDKDTKFALTCPKCARVMTKYQITGEYTNRLDICTSCDEAWIDSGEWALLKSLELARELPTIFRDTWQKKITRDVSEKQRFGRLAQQVGAEDAARAREIREWLEGHASKATIVRYIGFE